MCAIPPESLSLLFILPFRPRLGHAQMKVQFMQPANGRAAQFDLQLFLEVAHAV
jgi:hypothetical protein